MNVKDILIAARKLIETPNTWTKGYYARNINGVRVNETSDEAHCFCSEGAIYRAGRDDLRASNEARSVLRKVMGKAVPAFNDGMLTTHEDVLRKFDEAICSLEK